MALRLSDAILGAGQAYNNDGRGVTMVDLTGASAGQMGITTQLDGYIQNSSYVRRNSICFVMDSPRGFNSLPNSKKWHATLKGLLELGAMSFDGLHSTITHEFATANIGRAGEIQEDVNKSTRERSQLVFTFREKYGKPINRFFTGWICYLMDHPEYGIPAFVTLGIGDQPNDLLPDVTSATCLFIEPDPLHKFVVEAWLVTNMMPFTAGAVDGNRDITAPGQTVDYSIQFTGIQQVGPGVNALAQQYLSAMSLTGANPANRPAFMRTMNANITSERTGYADQLNRMAQQAI